MNIYHEPIVMFPFIVNYKDIVIPTFFFMIVLESLAAAFYVYWQAGRRKLSQIAILDIAMYATVAGVLGARFFHIIVEAPINPKTGNLYYLEDLRRIFYFWQGGFVGYGVFIGITIASISYLKIKKLPIKLYCDLIALGCPIIIFMMRIGCLGAGCCYGKPTDFFIHLTFHNPQSEVALAHFLHTPLHATQIYDMINAAFTFGLIHWVDKRKKFEGQVMLTFFMSYAFFRFWIEFLRGDADRGVHFNDMLSTSQITGIVIWAICLPLYFYWSKKQKSKVIIPS